MAAPRATQAAFMSRKSVGNFCERKPFTRNEITTPSRTPDTASTAVSRSTTLTMVSLEAPIDLRMPISRVRSSTEVYID